MPLNKGTETEYVLEAVIIYKVNFRQSLIGFLSPRWLALPDLKNPVCPTIYSYLKRE